MSEVKHPVLFRNFYRCPNCGHLWLDQWDCGVDDECPACEMRDISPYRSVELNPETGEVLNPETAEIPLDHAGRPKVSSAMKAGCIGEFSFTIEVPEIDEEQEFTGQMMDREVTVPWDLCKKIYKAMASRAMQDAKEAYGP